MSSQCLWWQTLTPDTTTKQTNTHTFLQTSQDTNALSTALKSLALDLWAQGTRKHYTTCIHSWEKTSKDQFSWTTWTHWPGMARTRSGCPGRSPPSPPPPTSSHTLVICPSDSLLYPPTSTFYSTYWLYLFVIFVQLESWHVLGQYSFCLNPLSCHQWLWTTCLVLKCNKLELSVTLQMDQFCHWGFERLPVERVRYCQRAPKIGRNEWTKATHRYQKLRRLE